MVNRVDEDLPAQWQDTVNLFLGIWLAVSPWILPYLDHQLAAWNTRLTGLAIAVTAGAALINYEPWKEWVNVILAAWLIVSPWILGYSEVGAAFYNQFAIGIVAGVLALWSAGATPESGRVPRRW
jgi:hypothetical protein